MGNRGAAVSSVCKVGGGMGWGAKRRVCLGELGLWYGFCSADALTSCSSAVQCSGELLESRI